MSKPRKQTYTMDMYLRKVKDKDISNDANVQRNFVWSDEQVNELIVTVLTDDYIPPIILGEEESSQLRIADGGQRTAALNKFRYGNHKITSSVEDSIIPYKKKNIGTDGSITWEDALFDIKNKTYDKLPEELKKMFDEYQIETVIHEHCDMHKISKYIKRYNNHTSMNTNQKAFTYLDKYAETIRKIKDSRFCVDYSDYTEKEKNKGVVERVMIETVMCSNHLADWKKQTKTICKYLNDNGTQKEFDHLADNLHRLESVITKDTKSIFNSKDSFIFLTLFDRFTELGIDDNKFGEFLIDFNSTLRKVERNSDGLLFDEIDKDKGTKDKAVIVAKLDMLLALMYKFLEIKEEDVTVNSDVLAFVKENVSKGSTQDDIELYEDCLNDLTLNVDNNTKLLDKQNHPSLVAIVTYACEKDIYIDEWFVDFFERNSDYIRNQRENYLHMKTELDEFVAKNDNKCA